MTENLYERAAATWVAREIDCNPDRITKVDFHGGTGGGCTTCGYGGDESGIEFRLDGRPQTLYFPQLGRFIEGCVEILKELE